MSKLPNFDPKTRDPELLDMLAAIRNILNNGGYIPPIYPSVPTAAGEQGQSILVQNGDFLGQYIYTGSAWQITSQAGESGWGYIEISGTPAAQVATLSFAKTYTKAPHVRVTNIGTKTTASAPTKPGDITSANTLRSWVAYAPTTTNCSVAVYTGNGSGMTSGQFECFSYEVVPTA